jgi:hypothetical protein
VGVVRSILEQLRTLLTVWLLLTVPVICHHETAVTIVGVLAGQRPHASATVAHTHAAALHAHGDHTAVSAAAEPTNDPLATAPPLNDMGRWWCSHHTTTGAGLLPEGLDNSALLVRPPVAALATSSVSAAGAETILPSSHTSSPPAPPPRPALV